MDLEIKFSYHFPDGIILTEDGILTKGNEQSYIPPKELGVLFVLLESAGNVVSKDMIIESVWKNVIVSDESLTRCVYSLRCIFEQIGYTRCIETIYRKGYRFSGQVFKIKGNQYNEAGSTIALFPFTTSHSHQDPLTLNQELIQFISNKKNDNLYIYPMAATQYCIDNKSQTAFLARFKPDYFITGRINQHDTSNSLYVEVIDAKSFYLVASTHLQADDIQKISQFIISNLYMVMKDPETAPGLISQNESSNEHVLSKEMSAGKNALNEFTPESIVKAITIFENLIKKYNAQLLINECYCLLAECHMSLALHGIYEHKHATQKALEFIDKVSDKAIFDGKILGIMGLITGLSGQATTSRIFFDHAQIKILDVASLYYYKSLVNIYNERIEDAISCIEQSLLLEPKIHKTAVIKKSIDAYVSTMQNKKSVLSYHGTEKEHHLAIINNIQKLRQLTNYNNTIDFNNQYAVA
ncbi:winged helix-turn-helix domain-containing protein [Escherichia marmotae]|uniref:winged helix-turn-helix domain-containing protein n=1 Tax=Escherichia marmotae TaxID=1499973 RepID=UPI0015E58D1F|nr:winged helix-turn-helix domain-containing protein [Escherichia marmotae]MED9362234.1 winged helix-turn-helix domain-containing protein [Escherichia marmotae]MED9497507.1 winged helix-turn-helix domain-containing protein [Escherichia marmotae]QLP32645.1 winged helix-turn-helix domain-containing protein [Escherichia marmotae]